jgi:ferredoxin
LTAKVTIDTARCSSYGICAAIHPEVFAVPPGSPWGVVTREALDDEDVPDVEEAVRACPVSAIILTKDEG